MTTDTLENTITLGKTAILSEQDWKAAVLHTLRIFSLEGGDAQAKADQLYHDYVVEKGFTDQCFAQDPVGAVMDDRHYWSS